jgi:hypothetical protein
MCRSNQFQSVTRSVTRQNAQSNVWSSYISAQKPTHTNTHTHTHTHTLVSAFVPRDIGDKASLTSLTCPRISRRTHSATRILPHGEHVAGEILQAMNTGGRGRSLAWRLFYGCDQGRNGEPHYERQDEGKPRKVKCHHVGP